MHSAPQKRKANPSLRPEGKRSGQHGSLLRRLLIDPILMEDEVIDFSRAVLVKGQLGIDDFVEECIFRFGKNFKSVLPG